MPGRFGGIFGNWLVCVVFAVWSGGRRVHGSWVPASSVSVTLSFNMCRVCDDRTRYKVVRKIVWRRLFCMRVTSQIIFLFSSIGCWSDFRAKDLFHRRHVAEVDRFFSFFFYCLLCSDLNFDLCSDLLFFPPSFISWSTVACFPSFGVPYFFLREYFILLLSGGSIMWAMTSAESMLLVRSATLNQSVTIHLC